MFVLDTIARKQHELREFERRRDVAKHALEHLTAQLEALDGPKHELRGQTARTGDVVPFTGPEKVALFRSLFRGRDDVFPVLWTSSKTGRTGYSPACSNEWTPGVCEKLDWYLRRFCNAAVFSGPFRIRCPFVGAGVDVPSYVQAA